ISPFRAASGISEQLKHGTCMPAARVPSERTLTIPHPGSPHGNRHVTGNAIASAEPSQAMLVRSRNSNIEVLFTAPTAPSLPSLLKEAPPLLSCHATTNAPFAVITAGDQPVPSGIGFDAISPSRSMSRAVAA